MTITRLKIRLLELTTNITKHEIFLIAGSIAYTTALALAPFMIILLAVAALLGQDMQTRLFGQLSNLMGESAGSTVRAIIESADNRPNLSGVSGIVGIVILTLSASALFSQLRIAFDKINEFEVVVEGSGIWYFIREKLFSVGLVLGFAFLSVASLAITTIIAVVFPPGVGALWELASSIVNFGIFTLLFAAMYKFIPSEGLSWKSGFIAGAVSAVFYLMGKTLISIYLATAGFGTAYGAAGTLVVFLAWVYYSAATLLISYEVARIFFLSEVKKVRN